MSSFGKFILGGLVGGALGAAIGMLLAPRSGAETRHLIQDEFSHRYNDSLDSLKASADQLKAKAKHLSEELEELGRRTVEKFSEAHSASNTGDA